MTTSATHSKALVSCNPAAPHISLHSHLELLKDKIASQSLKISQYEASIFPQITSNFTGQNFVSLSVAALTLPDGPQMDSHLDIEIITASHGGIQALPIVIFSHGYGTHPLKYRPLLGELASHGYTILSITHPSSVEEMPGLTQKEETQHNEKLALVMANNIRHVIERIRTGKLEMEGLGNPQRIILGGHSLGGAASIIVSRTDRTLAGCVNLDGFLKGPHPTEGVAGPLLIMTGDYLGDVETLEQDPSEEARTYAKSLSRSLKEYDTLHHNSPRSKRTTLEAGHMDFTDQPFRDYLAGKKTLDAAMRVHTLVSRTILDFFNTAL